MIRPFVTVQDQNGNAFVELARVLAVSGPFQHKNGPVSRRLILDGTDASIFVLNTPENAITLGFNPDDWLANPVDGGPMGAQPEPEPPAEPPIVPSRPRSRSKTAARVAP